MRHFSWLTAVPIKFCILALAAMATFPFAQGVADSYKYKESNPKGNSKLLERKFFVNCDRGKSLAAALRRARPGDTIIVSGICHEKVTITTDRLTLEGRENAIIDGQATECDLGPFDEALEGQIEIDAAQGVLLTGFTVQNSPVDGIFLRNGAAGNIRQTTVINSCDDGIQIDQSVATLESSSFTQNQEQGMNVFNNSSAVILSGTVNFNNNVNFGIQIQSSTVSVDSGAFLIASNNGFMGISIFSGGRAIAFTGSEVSIENNSGNGILLLDGGFVASRAIVSIIGNGNPTNRESSGVTLVDNSVFSITGGRMMIENNQPIGLVAENSTITLRPFDGDADFSIQNNGFPPNGPDMVLRFGTRATLFGDIGPILCDGTVLSQGNSSCPALPAAVEILDSFRIKR